MHWDTNINRDLTVDAFTVGLMPSCYKNLDHCHIFVHIIWITKTYHLIDEQSTEFSLY